MDSEGGSTGTPPPPPQKKSILLTMFFFYSHFVSECLKIWLIKRALDTGHTELRASRLWCAYTHILLRPPPPPPQWKSWIRPCTWISSSTFVGQTNYLYVWNDAQAMNGHLIAKLLLIVKKICFTFLITLSPNFKMVSSDLLSVCPPRHLQTPNSAFKAHVSNPHVPQISPTRRDCEADWIQACAPSANYPNISSSIYLFQTAG